MESFLILCVLFILIYIPVNGSNHSNLFLYFSAATDVKLKEEGFPETDFTVVQGFLDVQWDRIAPYPLRLFYSFIYLFFVFNFSIMAFIVSPVSNLLSYDK